MNPKDEFVIADYKDVRVKCILEFFIFILYLKKPTDVTVTIGNTNFGALLGDRLVDWSFILHTVVGRLVENVEKDKTTPICPYLFHMYKEQQVLLLGEVVTYNLGKEFVKYNYTLDPDPTADPSEPKQRANLEPLVTST